MVKANMPSAHLAKSELAGIGELVTALRAASERLGVFAQALDPEMIVSERHLLHAWHLASRAIEEKANFANTIENEVLVKAAAETRVKEAIAGMGAKEPGRFILLTSATGVKLKELLKVIKATASKPKFKPDVLKVKKAFCVSEKMLKNYSLEDAVLETIAMSGNEN